MHGSTDARDFLHIGSINLILRFTKCILSSRSKKFIIEEYIEPVGKQLHGDGFVQNGKVVFLHLGDHHFDSTINNLVPYSTTYPTEHPVEIVNACKNQIQDFMSKEYRGEETAITYIECGHMTDKFYHINLEELWK